MSFAIRAENLGKRYQLGLTHSGSIRELAHRVIGRLRGRTRTDVLQQARELPGGRRDVDDEGRFWALQDVSFEVKPGDVVGIIGSNGSGKSTLLKILSKITAPTTGNVRVRGRVASLLEIGTGFHQELSGRENVYLNGAILGMTKQEVRRKFDEIVAFAEIDKFIDTPVKRYSSGMHVRLAFAVAAHLEPEILVVDEVLAVGDGSFQRKCLGKMEDIGRLGRTILFVSHSMPAVTRLCPLAIHLQHGKLMKAGPAHEVIGAYLRGGFGTHALREWPDPAHAPGNGIARLRAVRILDAAGKVSDALDIRKPITLEMEFDVLREGHALVPNFHVYNDDGVCAFTTAETSRDYWENPRPLGRYVSRASIPGNFLAEGSILIGAALSTMDPLTVHFWERDAVAAQVIDTMDGDSLRRGYAGHYIGVVRPELHWNSRFCGTDVTDLIGANGGLLR